MPQTTFRVDSMNVVFWIHGQSCNYKLFVTHRVGEIHEKSNPNQWRYAPTKQNPANYDTEGGTELLNFRHYRREELAFKPCKSL